MIKLHVLTACLLLGTTSLFGAAVSEIPPQPEYPKRDNLTPEESQSTHENWRDAYAAWEASITPEQLLAKQRADEDAQHRKDETNDRARRYRLPLPTDNYDWKQVAVEKGLSPVVIAQLEKDSLAYGPATKQVFEPYLTGTVFITSDSLLNAFHVLFEDSFRELEFRQASVLRGQLEQLLQAAHKIVDEKMMPGNRGSVALRHDQLVLGPAIVLLGGSLELFDEALRNEIAAQVEKIRRADTSELPEWLGPPDPESLLALDYKRCKPVGFYTNSPHLSSYFSAVRWLQMIPFRAARELEFDAILLLRQALSASECLSKFERWREIWGSTDDLTLLDLRNYWDWDAKHPPSESAYANELRRQRAFLSRQLVEDRRCLINSDLKAKTPVRTLFNHLSFRVLASIRTQDAVLFQQLTDHRRRVQGLAVAAMLGSKFAEAQLAAEDLVRVRQVRSDFEAEREAAWLLFYPTVYPRYLHALSALFAPATDAAPAFMQSDAWAAKSCQTALAGWAQMRHTFTLQAKLNASYMGLVSVPPGFVEDNPEFFTRMACLIEQSHDAFAENACFQPRELEDSEKEKPNRYSYISEEANPPNLQQRWIKLGRITHSLVAMAHKQSRQQPWTLEEEIFLRGYADQLAGIMGYFGNSWLAPKDDAPRWAEVSHDPQRGLSRVAAIGRPRYFYVLYPWNGIQILCTGSVMQYYEYDSNQRLTDAEWKALLDSPQAPNLPTWLTDYASPPGPPVARKRH